MSLAIVILAAGKGKRMGNPDLPKVMVELIGTPLIGHVLSTISALHAQRTIAIVGHHREIVMNYVLPGFPFTEFAVQEEQLGTGHAVQQCEPVLENFDGDVLILCGDAPLISAQTLSNFILKHKDAKADLSVLSGVTEQPKGYGRIVRDADGNFSCIVEEKDATDEQRLIDEINSGIYIVGKQELFNALQDVQSNNASQEYYLTDIVSILGNQGKKICAFKAPKFIELVGINTPTELHAAEQYYSELKA
ncbi:MAG: NTP transferase domain-containing protein [Bacteriodetes bacterium]|nr:NTP transferase domain-containing protein [Bacteroidota bacterium]